MRLVVLVMLALVAMGRCGPLSPEMENAVRSIVREMTSSGKETTTTSIQSFGDRMSRRKSMDERKRVQGGKKPFILVTGPESSGNRYTVDLLIKAAGCHGKSGHVQPLDQKKRGKQKDWSALDTTTIGRVGAYPCIAMHRSFPHNNKWAKLDKMAKMARNHGFDPHVVVLFRDPESVHDSQVKRKHVPNLVRARGNTQRAYLEIFRGIIEGDIGYTPVMYEHLVDDDYIEWLFSELGIRYTVSRVPKFKDANPKHHDHDDSEIESEDQDDQISDR